MKLVRICEQSVVALAGALAAGEGLGTLLSRGAEAWPAVLALAVVVTLVGYGFAIRGWRFLAMALVGLSLFLHSALANEQIYRESPWLRGTLRHSPDAVRRPLVRDLSRRIGWGLSTAEETANLNRAILLGDKSCFPRRLKSAFVEAGTIHVFAISGLHVMVIARLFMFFAALCFVPLRWQGVAALPLLWVYIGLIGMPASAVRAALMATLYFAAPLVWRKPNALIAWALTFLLVHLVNPSQISNIGSLFSFTVMFVLVLAARLARGMGSSFRQMVFLSSVAWAAGVPIAAMAFGRISPGAVIANLALLGLAANSVVWGVLGLCASFLSASLAKHLNNFAALSTEGMIQISRIVAAIPGSLLEVSWWNAADTFAWYLALGLVLYLIAYRQTRQKLI